MQSKRVLQYFELRSILKEKSFDVTLRCITLGGVSITTAATHVCVLCMRCCNGITAYILLHTVMKFYLEMIKTKEMRTFLYVLSDHPSYNDLSSLDCQIHECSCLLNVPSKAKISWIRNFKA